MTGHSEVEILLVEDNPSDVELTLRALKARNLANQVFVARDGAEALEFFFGEQSPLRDIGVAPRVILLDLKLPKVDGLEVLRRLKGDERTRRLPVVVLTSSKEEPGRVPPRRQQLHRQAGGLRGLRARRLRGRALLVALERAAALIRCRISCAS